MEPRALVAGLKDVGKGLPTHDGRSWHATQRASFFTAAPLHHQIH